MAIGIRSSSAALAAFGLLALSAAFFPHARAASIFDITFPIPELGNCADKNACKAYCALPENESACEAFAADHGITVHHDDAASSARTAIEEDGGPGNCAVDAQNPEAACRAYCDDPAHINACVSYGERHGLLEGEDLAQAKKVAAALAEGAKLPEGCTDQSSCKATCENPPSLSVARSCFAFAKQAGLLPPGVDAERAEKTFEAIANGDSPFASIKDFKQCENPPSADVLKKCVDFGEKHGLISPENAALIRKTGGKGPGGCTGKDACEAFCQDHQEECFAFAKENGLVPPEQEAHMKEAAARFSEDLTRAPEAVRACVHEALGDDGVAKLAEGTPPSPSIGEKLRSCFTSSAQGGPGGPESTGPFESPQGNQGFGPHDRGEGQGPRGIPQDVRDCVVAKLGEKALAEGGQPTAETAQTIRTCFDSLHGGNASFGNSEEGRCNGPEGCGPQGGMPPAGTFASGTPFAAPPQNAPPPGSFGQGFVGQPPPGAVPEGSGFTAPPPSATESAPPSSGQTAPPTSSGTAPPPSSSTSSPSVSAGEWLSNQFASVIRGFHALLGR